MSTLVTTALRHNTSASNNIILDSSGRVGIGTATPAVTLNVNSGSTDEIARFDGSSVVNPYISLYRQGTRMGYWYAPSASYMELAAEGRPLYLTATGAQPILFNNNSNTRMTIDSSGRVAIPSQPSFYAKGLAQNYVLGNQGDLILGTTVYNIGGHYNTSTYRFTAPIAGRYLFTWSVFNNGATGRCSLKLNGGSYSDLQMDAGAGLSQAAILNLSANDFVSVGDWQNISGLNYWGSHSHFSGILLG